MREFGLFGKVFGGTVAVILITAFVVYLAVVPTIENNLEQESLQRVEREVYWAAEICEKSFDRERGVFEVTRLPKVADAEFGSRFTLVLPDGQVLFDSHQEAETMDNHGSRPELRTPGELVTRFSHTLQREMTYLASPVFVAGTVRGFVRVSLPVEDRGARLAEFRSAIEAGALIATLISLLLAAFFARRVTQPLSEIAELVGEIGSKQTKRRLAFKSRDEVGQLAQAVNRMADELDAQMLQIDSDRTEREAIFAALAEGLLAVDEERRVLFINEPGRQLLDTQKGELKGKPVWELTRNSRLIEVIDACLSRGTRAVGEARFGLEDEERIVELTAEPMVGDGDAERGCVVELRDVTELRRLEAVRRDFVSNVSHELKTPLTAMRGYTEAMLEDPDMPEGLRRSFLEKAHKNTERLVAIVTDLLSLSRLESEEHKLALEVVDAEQLVRRVFEDLRDLAESRKTRLVLEAPQPGLTAKADPRAFGMALSNLISNAIQYSPDEAEVRVVLGKEGRELRVDVIDHGPGIPAHEQERVFERFYRLDRARSRKLGGTGLGLSIVRHVMAAHHGRVELESTPGQGCRFRLFLPFA